MIWQLSESLTFPDPEQAGAAGPLLQGLLATGGDLSVDRLLLAYRSGIFPWSDDPITWWSPDPRAVLPLQAVHVPRRLRSALRHPPFRITVDQAFQEVIQACAQACARRPSTWISPRMADAYTLLHRAGWAHSVECWAQEQLVGGVYGVAIGGFFAGESMFHTAPNASKLALLYLVSHLRERRFTLFDLQMLTPITAALGGLWIPRRDYLQQLRTAVDSPTRFI